MNPGRFIFRSLVHFKGQNLALLAGTLIATAVLTGALVVGDSVRYSLQNLTKERLGSVKYAITTGSRFVRAELARELAASLNTTVSAELILPGIGINPATQERINQLQVIGADSSFWKFGKEVLPLPADGEVYLSHNLAMKLQLKTGDAFLLRVEQVSYIPINVPLSPENNPSRAIRLTVKNIVGDDNLGRFSLKTNQVSPFNVFVNHATLARLLDLNGKSNLLLVADNSEGTVDLQTIDKALEALWNYEDAGLKIRSVKTKNAADILSDRVFIDPSLANAFKAVPGTREPMITYLVNSLASGKRSTPYSFVTALDSSRLPAGTRRGDILINQWLASDLGVGKGDTLRISYFVIGPLRKLTEKSARFHISAVIPIEGNLADRDMMPDFPGLSDAGSCRDWNTGIPIDLKKIRDKDEQYWDDYKGTPKAIISMVDGMNLWQNSFGSLTAIRIEGNEDSAAFIASQAIHQIKPYALGIRILPVLNTGTHAAANSVDFGQLFLSLSFFIIAAAVLLLVLIISLAATARSKETALLAGLGIGRKQIFRLHLFEYLIVVTAGSILGAIAGILYNRLLIYELNTVWQGAVQTNLLIAHVNDVSLITGAASGLLLAIITVFFIQRRMQQQQISAGLKETVKDQPWSRSVLRKWKGILVGILIALALLLVLWSVIKDRYQDPVLFLSSGTLVLLAGIFGFSALLDRNFSGVTTDVPNLKQLGYRNMSRKKGRSMTVVSLMAIGIFSIILTGAYRKTFHGAEQDPSSGTGGYKYWIETSIPVPSNLNDPVNQKKYFPIDSSFRQQVHFVQFHSLDGDDASCLNLNQVQQPRILGVNPAEFDARGAFSFLSLSGRADPKHPWLELLRKTDAGTIPAFADQTVIQYGLMKALGDTLFYQAENGKKLAVVLCGGLDNSIFQGNILIDDAYFSEYFPSSGGSKLMLMDVASDDPTRFGDVVNQSLADYGVVVESTANRLAAFNQVEDTYLSVFMILGGLGLILGTLGMAIVLFRNILERKRELALLMAIGFSPKLVKKMLFAEHFRLFLYGLFSGLAGAVVAIIPSLVSPGFQTQTVPLIWITLVVLLFGTAGSWIMSHWAIHSRMYETLRND